MNSPKVGFFKRFLNWLTGTKPVQTDEPQPAARPQPGPLPQTTNARVREDALRHGGARPPIALPRRDAVRETQESGGRIPISGRRSSPGLRSTAQTGYGQPIQSVPCVDPLHTLGMMHLMHGAAHVDSPKHETPSPAEPLHRYEPSPSYDPTPARESFSAPLELHTPAPSYEPSPSYESPAPSYDPPASYDTPSFNSDF